MRQFINPRNYPITKWHVQLVTAQGMARTENLESAGWFWLDHGLLGLGNDHIDQFTAKDGLKQSFVFAEWQIKAPWSWIIAEMRSLITEDNRVNQKVIIGLLKKDRFRSRLCRQRV